MQSPSLSPIIEHSLATLPLRYAETRQTFERMHAAFLQDGILSHAFGKENAYHIVTNLLHTPFIDLAIRCDTSTGCFFIHRPESHPLCLDFHYSKLSASLSWTFIVQQLWHPKFSSGTDRFVANPNVQLQNTMFFLHEGQTRECGVTAKQAIEKEAANHSSKQRQINGMTQSSTKKPIDLKNFIAHLGRSVQRYLKYLEDQPKEDPLVSPDGRTLNIDDILILGAVNVSQGGWQPILAHNIP